MNAKQCHGMEVRKSMIPWNNKIMKTHGRSIREKILDAYRQSFQRACIVYLVEKRRQEFNQAKVITDFPDDKWGHT
jgi:hypothetical protein